MTNRKFSEQLDAILEANSKVVVVGIGSVLRSDDAAGVVIVEKLGDLIKTKSLQNLVAINGGSAAENVTGEIIQNSPSHILFIDAADLGIQPGGIEFIDSEKITGISFVTHMLPLKVIIEYLKQSIDCQILVIGIQPQNIEFSADITLSPAVSAAVNTITDAIAAWALSVNQ